jgi:N-alpha-acetyltransferase 50
MAMNPNGTANVNSRVQASIRSFFLPHTPSYTPPPVPLGAPTTPRDQISSSQSGSNTARDFLMPLQANVSPITHDHIQPLRRINSLLLPINYPDSFYHKILDPSPISLSRVILWTEPHSKETKVVGGIVCRLDPSLAPGSAQILEGSYDVYLQSLVLLSPYREKGLAAAALRSVIEAATQQDGIRIRELYAHVWTENTEALEWYAARGFQRDEQVINGYYKRLKPETAWILRRKLVPSDHLPQSSTGQHTFLPTPPALSKSTSTPPQSITPPGTANPRPDNLSHTKSFQDRRPDMEWNDLPEDVLSSSLLKAPGSGEGSSASSRSTSRSRLDGKGRKKGRSYPAAAFDS